MFAFVVAHPCFTRPCLNSGICIDSYSGYSAYPEHWNHGYLHYLCLCESGFTGPNCEGMLGICLKFSQDSLVVKGPMKECDRLPGVVLCCVVLCLLCCVVLCCVVLTSPCFEFSVLLIEYCFYFSVDICKKCDINAKCVNSTCACVDGFIGDGFKCRSMQ